MPKPYPREIKPTNEVGRTHRALGFRPIIGYLAPTAACVTR